MIKLESESQFNSLKKTQYLNLQQDGALTVVSSNLIYRLEEKYNHFNFVSVDRDEFIDLAIENDIMGIPSF